MTMTIGLTYDLRSEYLAEGFSEEETAEFDRDDTVTAIETTIRSLGYQTERIGHGRQLAAALAAGRYLEKPWPTILLGWALLITVATVATGNHYAIDSICGLIVALGVYLLIIKRSHFHV